MKGRGERDRERYERKREREIYERKRGEKYMKGRGERNI
jgi:hypothetical protein